MKFVKGSVRRSLKYSIFDGLFAAAMMGVSEVYILPYGIALGASAAQVGLLAGVPAVLAALIQLNSAAVTQRVGSRLKLINVFVFLHALLWTPIILIPFFFPEPRTAVWALLGAMVMFSSVGAFTVPVWQSLMSDYIPVKKRGKYFGWRNKLQGAVAITVTITSGLILHAYGKDSVRGFTLIFIFAMISRFCSWLCLMRMTEPFRKSAHDVYFSLYAFLRQLPTSNFAKFVLLTALMTFAVNISASLFSVFLLKELKFGYAAYMTIVTTASLSGVVFQQFWGRYGDRLGNLRVLRVVGWGITILPALWIFSQNFWFAIVIQATAGCFWGGFNLLMNNFIMEAVTPEKRIRCISYFNLMNNTALLAGAALGGKLLSILPPLGGYSFLSLFLLSCVARMLVMAVVSPRIKEVRRA